MRIPPGVRGCPPPLRMALPSRQSRLTDVACFCVPPPCPGFGWKLVWGEGQGAGGMLGGWGVVERNGVRGRDGGGWGVETEETEGTE